MSHKQDSCQICTHNLIQALRQNKENENISFFLKACEDYGLNKTDLFQVISPLPVSFGLLPVDNLLN